MSSQAKKVVGKNAGKPSVKKVNKQQNAWRKKNGKPGVVSRKETSQQMKKFERQAKEVENTQNAEVRDAKAEESETNDVTWYKKFVKFATDAATLPFAQAVGDMTNIGKGAFMTPNTNIVVPGLMSMAFIPTPGYSVDNTSAINRSSLRFYAWMRNVQKIRTQYDPADVMMYMYAVDSCIMFWAMMRRAYAAAKMFSPVNQYYPRALLYAMGINPSVMNNLAEFRQYINEFALQLGQFAVPKELELFKRHRWMCSGIYKDSASDKSQLYMFMPNGFWQFDNTAATGGQLNYVDYLGTASTPTIHTVSDLQTIGTNLIQQLAGDQDVGRISADLFAAYKGNVWQFEFTDETYMVLPSYDEVVLSQIENACFNGGFQDGYVPVIKQDPSVNNGAIIFQPVVAGLFRTIAGTKWDPFYNCNRVINIHNDDVTPDQVLEATRLIQTTTIGAQGTNGITMNVFGSEMMTTWWIWTKNQATNAFRAAVGRSNQLFATSDGENDIPLEQTVTLMSQFDWHPLFYAFGDEDLSEVNSLTLEGVFGDVDNIAMIQDAQLKNLHDACLLSLFDVPEMGENDLV